MDQKEKKRSFFTRIRNYFIAGVVVLIPIGITVYFTLFIISISSKILPNEINPNHYLPYNIPGVEILITIILITIIGWMSLSFLGRKMLLLFNNILKRIPISVGRCSIILLISVAGSIIGTYSAPPTDEEVLINFYKQTRPWGFWKPIYSKIKASEPGFEKNTAFKRDMFNVVIGTLAQTLLVIIPLYLIMHKNISMIVSIVILIICVIILKKNWWDYIKNEPNITRK